MASPWGAHRLPRADLALEWWLTGRFRGGNAEVGADYAARSSHVGSICFFRSNQLLTFAKIGLSATEAALDARD